MSFFVLLNFRAFYIIVFESAVVIRVFFRCTTLMIWRSFSRLIVRLSFILSNCLFLTYLHEECNTSDGLRTDLCLFTVTSPYGFSWRIMLPRPLFIYGCGWGHRSGCSVTKNALSINCFLGQSPVHNWYFFFWIFSDYLSGLCKWIDIRYVKQITNLGLYYCVLLFYCLLQR